MNVEVDPLIEALYYWSDVSGVLLMGIIGGTLARQRGYDIVGFFFIAMFSALGGGMIRDVLINRGTVAAMSQPEYLYLAFAGALIARFFYFKGRTWDYIQSHGDAIVSALWAATGTVKALTYGLPLIPCVMMGVFTATGGSMIRDISMGREPAVFGDNQPTVIPAVACAAVVLVADSFDHLATGMLVGPVVSFILTLFGIWAGWRIPARQEWAPLNDTAAQVMLLARKAENKGRAVGRRLEPTKVRSWRHQQMEKALQRRIEKQVQNGRLRAAATSDATELLESFTDTMEQLHGEAIPATDSDSAAKNEEALSQESKGILQEIGVDLSGDSYEDYDEDEPLLDPEMLKEQRENLDIVLSDEKLTDELVEHLVQRYKKQN
ncbi:hypothetical protein WM42_2198 [Corynebacterium simulans]|uniref:Glycine transporter domain-containing protein n=1 Tax=Corynebacterium simulans TaxID=146827 RepID=A0ABR5V8C4_9CORY|nr:MULTISPECIES: trimeric intracellular cation channel family protein [Corynebacterium]AMO89896.1 hypothetical protein WM42_2198 [Corynebacterium simulans]KXU17662.1 hypothetical protein WM41_1698 [Corynebacterium simulans]OFM01993.1 hypothetical protein HMPREF2724_06340 [Corynebacterium sp. HMSC071F07]OFR39444.1 hypothetical protein HMPREF2888_08370 [Corynebacterium sp. HMSC077D03]OFT46901.1 hypothetical protein HMPREF3158_05795 [Corynebacterium sp. HMSC06G04]